MRTFALTVLFFTTLIAHAQSGAPSWLEESLYGNGKINAVIAVVAIIIIGLGIWMFRMDGKLTRMERMIKK